jgi:serine phosphatase RsbU (regulator of sigma subunit)
VIRDGQPVLINGVNDKERVANAESGEHLEITRMLDRQSLMVLPIVAAGRSIGALTLAQRKVSHRRFTRRDIPVARELGVRAGSALQNAFTHGRLRDAFVDVQRALLPRRIPLLAGVRLGTCYVPAGAASEVGGDWYAVVPMGGDRIGLAVGDAVGSGPRATAAMARARFALLALAHKGAAPSAVLTDLNELLMAIREDDVLTVVYGILDLARWRWTEARAGHLPTILRGPDGSTQLLDTKPGVPLAVVADAKYEQHDYDLAAGTRVVLYTDGLVERRGEVLDTGIERLRTRLAEEDADLDAAGAAITEALVGDVPGDDVAVLIAEVGGSPVA